MLRDADHPFRNIQTFKGITWQHLREVEQRLKRDILIEASQHHNILIHREDIDKVLCIHRHQYQSQLIQFTLSLYLN